MRWPVRFYPARWRQRYEAEFLAFLAEEGSLSPLQQLDLLRGLLDAHVVALRERWRSGDQRRGGVSQLAGTGMGVLFTTSGNGGVLMRRQPIAVVFLLLGLALGLLAPAARQTATAAFSSPPPGYTAEIYQDIISDPAADGRDGLTSVDIVNTGRAMPRLVVVVPPNLAVTPTGFEALRDPKVCLVHYVHLGHGISGYPLCPLAHGQTATVRMWWRASGTDTSADLAFYGRVPNLSHGYDSQAAVRDVRS